MPEWEYTVQRVPDEGLGAFEDALNSFGNDGWELVGPRGENYLIFKRRKLTPEEIFGETWTAYRDRENVSLDRINTDAFRKGWPSPTIYREHEAIHIMADMLDRALKALNEANDECPFDCDRCRED